MVDSTEKPKMRLNLRTGTMVSVGDVELEPINLEVFINGEWRSILRTLPKNVIEGLREGRIDKITDDDSEEVAARIPQNEVASDKH